MSLWSWLLLHELKRSVIIMLSCCLKVVYICHIIIVLWLVVRIAYLWQMQHCGLLMVTSIICIVVWLWVKMVKLLSSSQIPVQVLWKEFSLVSDVWIVYICRKLLVDNYEKTEIPLNPGSMSVHWIFKTQ